VLKELMNSLLSRIQKSLDLNSASKNDKVVGKVRLFLNELILYKSLLRNIDSQSKNYDVTVQRKIDQASERILKHAYFIQNIITQKDLDLLKSEFRRYLRVYIYKSLLLKRFYCKPRGYPGDTLMFEMIYNQKAVSNYLGKYFDHFVLEFSLAKSVINRKDFMKKFLLNEIRLRCSQRSVKISNIGSGSGREIRELLEENNFKKEVLFNCFDQDDVGLQFLNRKPLSSISFKQCNMLNLIGLGAASVGLPKQDIIYSLGLVDYFGDRVLINFINRFYRLLKKRGVLVIASCSSNHLERYALLTWFCDWDFYKRDAKNTRKLIRNECGIKNVQVEWEKNFDIFFIIIRKE